MDTFSFNPPRDFSEEGKRFLAVTGFGATNFKLNITDENKRFQIPHQVIGPLQKAQELLMG